MTFSCVNLGLFTGTESQALCVSNNGTLVGGSALDNLGQTRAVYWDNANVLHAMPGDPTAFSEVVGVSSDGTKAVGRAGGGSFAALWTGGPASWGAPINLGVLAGGATATVYGISPDGTKIFGASSGSGSAGQDTIPCVWLTASPGSAPTALPFYSGGSSADPNAAVCSNTSGTIIFGTVFDSLGNQFPAKWTGGPSWAVSVLNVPAGSIGANAVTACNAAGDIAVGYVTDNTGTQFSCLWNGTALTVLDHTQASGCDTTGNIFGEFTPPTVSIFGLETTLPPFLGGIVNLVNAVSPDGGTLVGTGVDGSSHTTAVKWSSALPVGPPLVWFRLNGGAWFPNGDPATLTGGISLDPLSGSALFAAVQGTGDAGLTLNAGATAFAGGVPLGYTAGLPHTGGGFTTLDPTKLFGSASLDGTHLIASFPTTPGLVQTVDGYTSGTYYFELKNPIGDIFSADWGGGVGINFNGGGNLNNWFNNGAFSNSNTNGGALLTGQTLAHELSSLGALGVSIQADVFNFALGSGDVLGIALYISGSAVSLQATLADLFMSETPSFVDFTQEANRRKFIHINGGAVNLQGDGSGPLAVTPPVFMSLEGTLAPNTFARNYGRGGAFAVSGPALTPAVSNPPPVTTTLTTVGGTVPFSAILGDYLTGNIYIFDPTNMTDNGTPRKWVRRWRALPHDTNSAVTFSYLAIDMETGIDVPPTSNPQLVLRWSDDGGRTWSGDRIVPAGPTGQTTFTVKFNRLGSTARFGASTRIFELSSTDPFKASIISAEIMTK